MQSHRSLLKKERKHKDCTGSDWRKAIQAIAGGLLNGIYANFGAVCGVETQ
jgi:hypothetical protein